MSEIMVKDLYGQRFTFYLKAKRYKQCICSEKRFYHHLPSRKKDVLPGPFNSTSNQYLMGQEIHRWTPKGGCFQQVREPL